MPPGEASALKCFSQRVLADASNNWSEDNKLGEGGYGIVYKGWLPEAKQLVAIKVLNTHGRDSSAREAAFYRELSMQVDQQHIVKLLGYCPQLQALVFEYMGGGNLGDWLASPNSRAKTGLRRRVLWLLQIASALAFLHTEFALPIRHWDIKPSNVLLSIGRKVAKVADMGLAKFYTGDATSTGLDARGTWAYLDPTYLMTGKYTPASDVYSFGLLLLQVVTADPVPAHARASADAAVKADS